MEDMIFWKYTEKTSHSKNLKVLKEDPVQDLILIF